jgi:erythrocyte band 7 integral membrane protein
MTSSGENYILEIQEEDKIENLIKKLLTYVCGFFTILFLPLLFIKAVKLVEKHEEAIIKRHGEVRQNRPIQAGWCFVIPCTDSFNRVDLRALKFDVEIKDVLTKDFVSLDILISFSYQVLNSMVFVNKLPNKMSTKDRLKIAIEAAFRLVITAKDYYEIQTISQRNAVLKDLKVF